MEVEKNSEVDETTARTSRRTDPGGDVDFEVRAGMSCDVRTASGNLRVRQGEGSRCQVRMTTNDSNPERRIAQVECSYDASSNRLLVDTKAGQMVGVSSLGIKKVLTRLIDNVRHDVDIELLLPVDASVKFRTASGNLRADIALDDVEVASASGDATLMTVRGSLVMRSASGGLEARSVAESIEVRTVSGDVDIQGVSGDVDIQSVSGDVSLIIDAAVNVRINSVSGDVDARVTQGLLIDIDANTVSGELASEISLGDAHGDSTEETLRLKVRTVSGDVRIRRN